jgi:hypothetical protein
MGRKILLFGDHHIKQHQKHVKRVSLQSSCDDSAWLPSACHSFQNWSISLLGLHGCLCLTDQRVPVARCSDSQCRWKTVNICQNIVREFGSNSNLLIFQVCRGRNSITQEGNGRTYFHVFAQVQCLLYLRQNIFVRKNDAGTSNTKIMDEFVRRGNWINSTKFEL